MRLKNGLCEHNIDPNLREGEKMLDPASQTKLNKSLLTIRIVYFACLISLAIYLFITNIIIELHHGSFESFTKSKEVNLVKNILYLISGLTVVVILILQRFLSNPNKIPLIPTSTTNIDEILRALTSGSILIFALCETVALYGLVLFLIAGLLKGFYFLLGLSFVLLLICFPKREKWEEIVKIVRIW